MKETAKVRLNVYKSDREPQVKIILEDTVDKCQLYILRKAEEVVNEKGYCEMGVTIDSCGLLRFQWIGENDEACVLEMVAPWV